MTASRLASRFLMLVLLGALAAGLAGCAAGTLPPVGTAAAPSFAPVDMLGRSAEAFRSVTSPLDVEVTLSGNVNTSGTGSPVSLDGTTVSMSFQATPLTMLVKIHASSSFDMEMRVVDGMAYISMPGALAGWYSMSIEQASALSPSGLPAGGPAPSIDPQVLMDLFQGPGLTIEYGAPQQLDGRSMQVVEITASREWLTKVFTTLVDASGQAATLPATVDEITAALPSAIPVTVWIDAQSYLIRRITTSVTGQNRDTIGATVDIRQHQGSLDVQAPPADSVTPFTDLLGGSMPSLPGLPSESSQP